MIKYEVYLNFNTRKMYDWTKILSTYCFAKVYELADQCKKEYEYCDIIIDKIKIKDKNEV